MLKVNREYCWKAGLIQIKKVDVDFESDDSFPLEPWKISTKISNKPRIYKK